MIIGLTNLKIFVEKQKDQAGICTHWVMIDKGIKMLSAKDARIVSDSFITNKKEQELINEKERLDDEKNNKQQYINDIVNEISKLIYIVINEGKTSIQYKEELPFRFYVLDDVVALLKANPYYYSVNKNFFPKDNVPWEDGGNTSDYYTLTVKW